MNTNYQSYSQSKEEAGPDRCPAFWRFVCLKFLKHDRKERRFMDEIRLLREEEVKKFEKYLKEMERAPATISKYLHDIRSFMRYRLGQNPHS